jgi:hypothetical protein
MSAISVQNDANMTRHRPLFELIKQRCGGAFVTPLSFNGPSRRSVPPGVELGKGSLLVKG